VRLYHRAATGAYSGRVLSPSSYRRPLRQSGELLKKSVTGYLARITGLSTGGREQECLFQLFQRQPVHITAGYFEQTIRGYGGVNLIVVDEAARVDDGLSRG